MTFMLNKTFAIKLTMIMTDIHIYLDLYLDLGLYLYLDLDLQIHLHLYWLQEYDLWFHFDHGCKSRFVYYFPRIHVLCQKFALNWWFPGKKPWVPPPLPSLPCPTLEFCVKQDTKYQDELVIILTNQDTFNWYKYDRLVHKNIMVMLQVCKQTKGLQVSPF